MSQFGGVERAGPWETAGDHERRIRALEAYNDCCDDIPEGLLRGCPSVELSYRTPGDLTAWWRMGDVFAFGDSGATVTDALTDQADFDADSPRNLDYKEVDNTARLTQQVPHPELGTGDDGAMTFNGTGGKGSWFDAETSVHGGPVNDVSEWGLTSDLLRSVVAWIRPTVSSATVRPLLGWWGMDGTGSFNEGWVVDYTSLAVSFKNFNNTADLTLTAPGTLTIDTWYHVAVTWDGATWKLYLNGVLVDSEAGSAAPETPPSSNGFSIGYGKYDQGISNVDRYATGTIDEVALYKKTLSAAEIFDIYQSSGAGANTFFCTATVVAGNSDDDPQAISSGDAEEFMVLTADGAGNTYWAFPTIEVLEDGV